LDFSAETLVENAKARFGETVLHNRIRGALGIAADADIELMKIALSVISTIAAGLAASTVGWPLPGTWPAGSTNAEGNDISGLGYREVWPFALQEVALNLFNFRTWDGYNDVPGIIRDLGGAAAKFLTSISTGTVVLDLGELSDPGRPEILMARDRSGKSFVDGVPDRENSLDLLIGAAWDYVH
jgi:hypothetical protein